MSHKCNEDLCRNSGYQRMHCQPEYHESHRRRASLPLRKFSPGNIDAFSSHYRPINRHRCNWRYWETNYKRRYHLDDIYGPNFENFDGRYYYRKNKRNSDSENTISKIVPKSINTNTDSRSDSGNCAIINETDLPFSHEEVVGTVVNSTLPDAVCTNTEELLKILMEGDPPSPVSSEETLYANSQKHLEPEKEQLINIAEKLSELIVESNETLSIENIDTAKSYLKDSQDTVIDMDVDTDRDIPSPNKRRKTNEFVEVNSKNKHIPLTRCANLDSRSKGHSGDRRQPSKKIKISNNESPLPKDKSEILNWKTQKVLQTSSENKIKSTDKDQTLGRKNADLGCNAEKKDKEKEPSRKRESTKIFNTKIVRKKSTDNKSTFSDAHEQFRNRIKHITPSKMTYLFGSDNSDDDEGTTFENNDKNVRRSCPRASRTYSPMKSVNTENAKDLKSNEIKVIKAKRSTDTKKDKKHDLSQTKKLETHESDRNFQKSKKKSLVESEKEMKCPLKHESTKKSKTIVKAKNKKSSSSVKYVDNHEMRMEALKKINHIQVIMSINNVLWNHESTTNVIGKTSNNEIEITKKITTNNKICTDNQPIIEPIVDMSKAENIKKEKPSIESIKLVQTAVKSEISFSLSCCTSLTTFELPLPHHAHSIPVTLTECAEVATKLVTPEVREGVELMKNIDEDVVEVQENVPLIDLTQDNENFDSTEADLMRVLEEVDTKDVEKMTLYRSDETCNDSLDIQALSATLSVDGPIKTGQIKSDVEDATCNSPVDQMADGIISADSTVFNNQSKDMMEQDEILEAANISKNNNSSIDRYELILEVSNILEEDVGSPANNCLNSIDSLVDIDKYEENVTQEEIPGDEQLISEEGINSPSSSFVNSRDPLVSIGQNVEQEEILSEQSANISEEDINSTVLDLSPSRIPNEVEGELSKIKSPNDSETSMRKSELLRVTTNRNDEENNEVSINRREIGKSNNSKNLSTVQTPGRKEIEPMVNILEILQQRFSSPIQMDSHLSKQEYKLTGVLLPYAIFFIGIKHMHQSYFDQLKKDVVYIPTLLQTEIEIQMSVFAKKLSVYGNLLCRDLMRMKICGNMLDYTAETTIKWLTNTIKKYKPKCTMTNVVVTLYQLMQPQETFFKSDSYLRTFYKVLNIYYENLYGRLQTITSKTFNLSSEQRRLLEIQIQQYNALREKTNRMNSGVMQNNNNNRSIPCVSTKTTFMQQNINMNSSVTTHKQFSRPHENYFSNHLASHGTSGHRIAPQLSRQHTHFPSTNLSVPLCQPITKTQIPNNEYVMHETERNHISLMRNKVPSYDQLSNVRQISHSGHVKTPVVAEVMQNFISDRNFDRRPQDSTQKVLNETQISPSLEGLNIPNNAMREYREPAPFSSKPSSISMLIESGVSHKDTKHTRKLDVQQDTSFYAPIEATRDKSNPVVLQNPHNDSVLPSPIQLENEIITIDLTWIDEVDDQEIQEELDLIFVKIEKSDDDEIILNQEKFPVAYINGPSWSIWDYQSP